jgi:hypothetical protein
MAISLSALRTDRALLHQKQHFSATGTHFCWMLSKPQGIVQPEGLGKIEDI